MNRWMKLVLCGSVGWSGLIEGTAAAQTATRERDVSITGPGGRTLERHMSATRGPGYVDRQLSVSRPAGTLERSVHASAAPAFRGGPPGPGPGWGPRPGPWFGPPPPRGGGMNPLVSFGIGSLAGAAIGATVARATAPETVVVASPPVIVQQPGFVAAPAVIAAPPVVVQQPTVVASTVDPLYPVALAAQRLQSIHYGTRREAAQALGMLGDPRGIAPLVDVLKNDWYPSVRIAAAEAIGQIGGPEAEVVLGRAVVYEKKDSVREAAAHALNVARAKTAAMAVSQPAPSETVIESRVEPLPRTVSSASSPTRRTVPTPPAPAPARPSAWKSSGSTTIPLEGPDDVPPIGDRVPPPAPTPVP